MNTNDTNKPSANSARVLIVDDNENNRMLLVRRMQKQGFDTFEASNGKEALALLEKYHYDLVLLDIMMPVMDGFKVLEIINQHAEWRHIPIIVISGLDDFDGIVRCIELGAEDFLLKPINNTLLNARIRASLEKKRLRDQEKFLLQKLQEYNNLLEQRIAEHQAELKMARRVQTSLLPKELPHVAGWDFAVTWIPAREIAGDYYDVIPMYNGSISFVVGDVTGKGLPASLFMVFARNCIRSNINRYKEAANQIFHANQQLCTESSEGLYITLFLCQIQPNSRQISFVNAGHEQPIFYSRQSNMLQTLPLSGKALGLEVDSQYQQHELTLCNGDFLCIFTDGVVDALNTNAQAFGVERLRQVLLERKDCTAQEMMGYLEEALKEYIGNGGWYDDVTILIVKKVS